MVFQILDISDRKVGAFVLLQALRSVLSFHIRRNIKRLNRRGLSPDSYRDE